MKFYSQDGQDKYLARLFNIKRGGVFIDIGAYDGVYYSNSYFFEKELGWSGICVEPNPVVFAKLINNRHCTCINCCINKEEGVFDFMAVSGYGEMLSGLVNFFEPNHMTRIDTIIKEHGGEKNIIQIPAKPLHAIFSDNGMHTIDYCNIDVEGGEISVLDSIDFSKVSIRVFTIENNTGSKNVRRIMASKGYRFLARLGADEVYEYQSKRIDLMLFWQLEQAARRLRLAVRSARKKLGLQ